MQFFRNQKRPAFSKKLDLLRYTYNTVVPEPGGPGGPLAPQYFADQLTLFEPGRADYPHLLLLAPRCFSPSGSTGAYLKYLTLFRNKAQA